MFLTEKSGGVILTSLPIEHLLVYEYGASDRHLMRLEALRFSRDFAGSWTTPKGKRPLL